MIDWEIKADAINQTYIYCERTKSRAWFRNDGDIHYFTFFEGDRSAILYKFFLGAYKVMLGYYKDLQVKDQYPVNTFNNALAGLVQDFVSPFIIFTRSEYLLSYLGMDDALMQTNIRLRSEVSARIGSYELKKMECNLFIGIHGLERFIIRENEKETAVKMVSGR